MVEKWQRFQNLVHRFLKHTLICLLLCSDKLIRTGYFVKSIFNKLESHAFPNVSNPI